MCGPVDYSLLGHKLLNLFMISYIIVRLRAICGLSANFIFHRLHGLHSFLCKITWPLTDLKFTKLSTIFSMETVNPCYYFYAVERSRLPPFGSICPGMDGIRAMQEQLPREARLLKRLLANLNSGNPIRTPIQPGLYRRQRW